MSGFDRMGWDGMGWDGMEDRVGWGIGRDGMAKRREDLHTSHLT
jgi:hypothetical protein